MGVEPSESPKLENLVDTVKTEPKAGSIGIVLKSGSIDKMMNDAIPEFKGMLEGQTFNVSLNYVSNFLFSVFLNTVKVNQFNLDPPKFKKIEGT